MQTAPLNPQTSYLDSTEPLWWEHMQDISGYELPDITSLPLDEQFQSNLTIAQTEYDIDLQNSGDISPEEFLLRDQTKVLAKDSVLLDNSNYSEQHIKMKEWPLKISSMEINKTNINSNNRCSPFPIDSENSQTLPQPSKEFNRPSAADGKKRHLSIFDREEPCITEEQDVLLSCNENKLAYEGLQDELEAAEEGVLKPEIVYKSISKMFLGSSFFETASPTCLLDPKEEEILHPEEADDMTSHLGEFSLMETAYFDSGFTMGDDDLYSLDPEAKPHTEPGQSPRLNHSLRLDIEGTSHLFSGNLLESPEMLKPVLKPESEFSLLRFMQSTGDSNNNCVPTTLVSTRPSIHKQDKHHQSTVDLRGDHKYGRGKPVTLPSPSCSSGRPPRKSATKFKTLMQEGLLDSTLDSSSVNSDSEDGAPKCKWRKLMPSKSSRKRFNSDSDRSSVTGSLEENFAKYREKRDKNNLSSRRSRQKRKMQQELNILELNRLEEENRKLRRREKVLTSNLDIVQNTMKNICKAYIESSKRD